MIQHWPDIQDVRRRLTIWTANITGRICEGRWISMYGNAIVVNALGLRGMQRLGFSDPCGCRRNHGKIFRWILWLGFQSVKGVMQFG
jgi:hypothetical protein